MEDYQHVFALATYDIVTLRKSVTISMPQGGAVVMRVPIKSTDPFDQITGKDLKT